MANVRATKNNTFEIRFVFDGNRRAFFPGPKVRTPVQAGDIAKKLERLAYCVENDEPLPRHIATWLKAIPDAKHSKLADWGLVQRRKPKMLTEQYKLDEWCLAYIQRGSRKASTNDQLEDVQRNLTKFFGSDRLITSITAGDAEDFRIWLETAGREVGKDEPPAGLAQNTVRRRVGRAREFFNLAVKRNIIASNPFAGESVGVGGNPDRQFFVPAEWIERCIATAGCEDWRIMLAFARYAGMRSHETRIQRWEDVDLPNRKMIVRSNKTPPTRVCPIFPELLPHLMRAKEMAADGADLIVTRYTPQQGINETFKKIVKRAGLAEWPKLMQNLRATRETELMAHYPLKDVTSWIGNSAPIAMKHYAMTMQSSFDLAIRSGVPKNTHNPTLDVAVTGDQQDIAARSENEKSPQNAEFCGPMVASKDASLYPGRDSNQSRPALTKPASGGKTPEIPPQGDSAPANIGAAILNILATLPIRQQRILLAYADALAAEEVTS